MMAVFAGVAALSFIALAVPGISLQASVLIPLVAFGVTPLSFTAAWAAWAIGAVTNTYMPLIMAGFKRIDQYLIRRKDGDPVSPVANTAPANADADGSTAFSSGFRNIGVEPSSVAPHRPPGVR